MSSDREADQLLNEFFAGRPVEDLRELLRSPDDPTVRAAAWIASELGTRARPLVRDLAALLDHPARQVRFFALDGILSAATAEEGYAIARAIHAVHDAEEAVRWKAMGFLARASDEQLAAGAACLDEPVLRSLTEWLAQAQTVASAGLLARLDSGEQIVRRFAAAAAFRTAQVSPSALLHAAQSADPEVRGFASDELEWIAARTWN